MTPTTLAPRAGERPPAVTLAPTDDPALWERVVRLLLDAAAERARDERQNGGGDAP